MRPEMVVIPAKGFATGKSRLMDVLSTASRQALNRAQLIQTVRAAAETFGTERTFVVSPCEGVKEAVRAERVGFISEREPPGLNEALEQARAELLRGVAGALCVLPVDLPCVSADVLRVLLSLCDASRALVVPDRAGEGTNFLRLPSGCNIPFSYGPDSFAKHIRLIECAGWQPKIVTNTCLRDDIDDACHLKLHDNYRALLAT